MIRRGALAGIAVLACATHGCVYHNIIYNAERLLDRAEAARRAGADSVATALYGEVARKTSEAYAARPASDWGPDALFLLGRARSRLGDRQGARDALTEARERADAPLRAEIDVYRAVLLAEGGLQRRASQLAATATDSLLSAEALAEKHLMNGRWRLSIGDPERGWWELDRAVDALREVRVEAGLDRARWAIAWADSARARSAVELLLRYPEGGRRLADVEHLIAEAGHLWGPALAADLLAASESSSWQRDARGRVRLVRARLLREAGQPVEAAALASRVAGNVGDAAAEARIELAGWMLAEARDITEAYAARRLLLPAAPHPGVVALSSAVDELETLTDLGLDEPLGWFAAGEVARDRLGAPILARGLFVAYADAAPTDPWAPKALLAAIEASPSQDDRAWLRGRLEAHGRSPYVLAAGGRSGEGFEALEEELQVRLTDLRSR